MNINFGPEYIKSRHSGLHNGGTTHIQDYTIVGLHNGSTESVTRQKAASFPPLT
jgi:hypothetical protein